MVIWRIPIGRAAAGFDGGAPRLAVCREIFFEQGLLTACNWATLILNKQNTLVTIEIIFQVIKKHEGNYEHFGRFNV